MTTRIEKVMNFIGLLLALMVLLASPPAHGQDGHHTHPPRDAQMHEQFYSKWPRPDLPDSLCCGQNDCYPTQFKKVGGSWFALKRDYLGGWEYRLRDPSLASSWVVIPDDKMEHNQWPGRVHPTSGKPMRSPIESPDGQGHVCMADTANLYNDGYSAPTSAETWFVYCAVLGIEG